MSLNRSYVSLECGEWNARSYWSGRMYWTVWTEEAISPVTYRRTECGHHHLTEVTAKRCLAAILKGNEATRRDAGGRIGGPAGEVKPKA